MYEPYEIYVTPEILNKKAEEWSAYIELARAAFFKMEQVISETEICFKGKSAEQVRKKAALYREEGEKLFIALTEYPDKLKLAAASYMEAERINQNGRGTD